MGRIYKSLVRCKNCKTEIWFDVPIGILVKDWLIDTKTKCSECECLYEVAKVKDSEEE